MAVIQIELVFISSLSRRIIGHQLDFPYTILAYYVILLSSF